MYLPTALSWRVAMVLVVWIDRPDSAVDDFYIHSEEVTGSHALEVYRGEYSTELSPATALVIRCFRTKHDSVLRHQVSLSLFAAGS